MVHVPLNAHIYVGFNMHLTVTLKNIDEKQIGSPKRAYTIFIIYDAFLYLAIRSNVFCMLILIAHS